MSLDPFSRHFDSRQGRWFIRIAFRCPLCEYSFERVWGLLRMRGFPPLPSPPSPRSRPTPPPEFVPDPELLDIQEFLRRERAHL